MNTENRQEISDPVNLERQETERLEEEYKYNHFCQWLDIANRCIFITVSKEREFISDVISFSNTKSGKLTIYVFSVGLTNDEFKSTFPGILEDFENLNTITHNYKIAIEIDAYDIIPKFEKIRDEMKDEKRSLIIKIDHDQENITA